jgi:hypothetical protein
VEHDSGDEDNNSIDEAIEEEVELPEIMCCSDDEDLIDVLNAEAEIEDLGKRKGTNAARDEIVKRLR